MSWENDFAAVLDPLVDEAMRLLPAEGGPDGPLRAQCRGQVSGLLVGLAARTLVLRLAEFREAGRLTGMSPQDRFASFITHLCAPTELAALLADYPVLADLLRQRAANTVDAFAEVHRRFVADRAAVVADLLGGSDPGGLTAVTTGLGDAHRRGRSTAVLRFADGRRVVYRPRRPGLTVRFADVVGWFNGLLDGLDLTVPSVLARADYSWTTYVEWTGCADDGQVRRFYHRSGALLALLHVLGAVDMHYGNLLADADRPVIVDAETLFHPDIRLAAAQPVDPADRALRDSVLRTGLLPWRMLGEHGGLDVSGLGGDAGRPYPTSGAVFAEPGTDRMRLVRRAVAFPGGENRPRIGGTVAEVAGYAGCVLDGFRAGYDALAAHREQLLAADGPFGWCRAEENRVVLRPTHHYATALDESTHPVLLADPRRGRVVRDSLGVATPARPGWHRLVDAEIADLDRGDIPVFTGVPGSRALWTSDGVRVDDVCDSGGLERARRTVVGMGPADRRVQEWVIAASLAGRGVPVVAEASTCTHPPTPAPPAADLIRAAGGLGDRLCELAVRDGDRVNWLVFRPADGHWMVVPAGPDLGHGFAGVALFLADLTAVTGRRRYVELARCALRPLPELARAVSTEPDLLAAVGADPVDGLAGTAYATGRVATVAGDEVLSAAAEALRAVLPPDPSGRVVDAASRMLPGTGLCTAHLLRQVLDRPRCATPAAVETPGLLVGLAGIGYALLRRAGRDVVRPGLSLPPAGP